MLRNKYFINSCHFNFFCRSINLICLLARKLLIILDHIINIVTKTWEYFQLLIRIKKDLYMNKNNKVLYQWDCT